MIFYNSSASALFCNKNIRFFLTDRFGGVSKEAFYSLNLGKNTNDNVVETNKNIIKQYLKINKLHYVNQIHQTNIIVLDSTSNEFLGDGDGILSSTPNLYAMVSIADCNPILLYSHKNATFALLHAGRKGLEQNIISKATNLINSNDIIAFVGVSIRQCCYEINGDLLKSYQSSRPKYLQYRNKKYYLDMVSMIKDDFSANHIQQVEIMEHCSCCDERFFSYRRQKECGRFALIASISNNTNNISHKF